MRFSCSLLGLIVFTSAQLLAQVVLYEGDAFPEEVTPVWERVGTFDADRSLFDGILTVTVDLGAWAPVPGGEQDFYRRSIPEFSGSPFFLEWRCVTDAPNSEIQGGGITVNAAGLGVANHFRISEDTVRIWRSNFIPFVFVSITPGVPHTYRVEHFGDQQYIYYIDGQVVDTGTPEGAFPDSSGRIIWGASMWYTENTSQWHYVRYGVIPQDHSGDYDSSGDVEQDDLYFFLDCLLGPEYDLSGPGCAWADMNNDGFADGADIAQFIEAMLP